MSKARKLLTIDTLKELESLTDVGVPVAKAMRRLGLEGRITRPTVVLLLEVYSTRFGGKVLDSLDPGWLDPLGEAVQEQPDNYNYIGYFPQGSWECKV